MCVGKCTSATSPSSYRRGTVSIITGPALFNDMGVPASRAIAAAGSAGARSASGRGPVQQDSSSNCTRGGRKFITANKDRPFFLYLPIRPSMCRTSGQGFSRQVANGRYGDWVEEVDWSTGQVLDTLAV